MGTERPPSLPKDKSPFDLDPKGWLKKRWPYFAPLWIAPIAFGLLPGPWRTVVILFVPLCSFPAGRLWTTGEIPYWPMIGLTTFVPLGIWILLLLVTAPFGGLPI